MSHYMNTPDAEIVLREQTFEFQRILVTKFGQSNSIMTALASGLSDTYWGAAFPGIQMVAVMGDNANPPNKTTYGVRDLDTLTYLAQDRIGFECSLMRDLYRLDSDGFALSIFGFSSTSALNWATDSTYPSLDPPNLYTQMIAATYAAMVTHSCSRVVFVWEQGENDAGGLTTANNYDDFLVAFHAALRAEFGSAMLGFVFGKLHADANPVTYPYIPELRASQVNFANATPLADMVVQDGVPLGSDDVHYDADGCVALGHLFALQVADRLGHVGIPPLSKFDYDEDEREVTFTDTTLPIGAGVTIVSWDWDFDDGNTSTSQHPVHEYAIDGSYDVTVTTTDSNGQSNTSVAVVVTVNGSIVGVTRDAARGVYCPADATEFATFLAAQSAPLSAITAPTAIYNCQAASGDLLDDIGSIDLVAAGTDSSNYQQTVTDWTRKGLKVIYNQTDRFSRASGGTPNPATTSQTWVWFCKAIGTPAANKTLFGISDNATGCQVGVASTGHPFITIAGNTTNGADTPTALGIGPWTITYNRTATTVVVTTPQEKITGTYGAVVDGRKGIMANGAASLASEYVYGFMFSGAGGEITIANLKLLLEAMGFVIPWS